MSELQKAFQLAEAALTEAEMQAASLPAYEAEAVRQRIHRAKVQVRYAVDRVIDYFDAINFPPALYDLAEEKPEPESFIEKTYGKVQPPGKGSPGK